MNAPETINEQETSSATSPDAIVAKARQNPTSKRLAINARCAQCECGEADAGWRSRIKQCATNNCALRLFRPYQDKDRSKADMQEAITQAANAPAADGFDPVRKAQEKPDSRSLAIRAYCWTCMGGGKMPNVQRAIGTCNVSSCALHHARPYQSLKNDGSDETPPSTDEDDATNNQDVDF